MGLAGRGGRRAQDGIFVPTDAAAERLRTAQEASVRRNPPPPLPPPENRPKSRPEGLEALLKAVSPLLARAE
jgi:hypothetical protein